MSMWADGEMSLYEYTDEVLIVYMEMSSRSFITLWDELIIITINLIEVHKSQEVQWTHVKKTPHTQNTQYDIHNTPHKQQLQMYRYK